MSISRFVVSSPIWNCVKSTAMFWSDGARGQGQIQYRTKFARYLAGCTPLLFLHPWHKAVVFSTVPAGQSSLALCNDTTINVLWVAWEVEGSQLVVTSLGIVKDRMSWWWGQFQGLACTRRQAGSRLINTSLPSNTAPLTDLSYNNASKSRPLTFSFKEFDELTYITARRGYLDRVLQLSGGYLRYVISLNGNISIIFILVHLRWGFSY